MSAPQTSIPILTGARDLLAGYDVVLCDVWGVIHNGREHFALACDALARFREGGGRVVLVTNAPRPNPPVREQLDRLGVPRSAFDDIVTSGDVTLAFIASHGNAPLHHIGPERDLTLFEILKKLTGHTPALVDLADATYVVCTGLFDDQTETPEDYDAAFAQMRARNLDFISANPDLVYHGVDIGFHAYTRTCADFLAKEFPGRFHFHPGDSREVLPRLATHRTDLDFDLFHVDGGHTDELCRADISNCLRLAKGGAGKHLVLDDINASWIFDVFCEFVALGRLATETLFSDWEDVNRNLLARIL